MFIFSIRICTKSTYLVSEFASDERVLVISKTNVSVVVFFVVLPEGQILGSLGVATSIKLRIWEKKGQTLNRRASRLWLWEATAGHFLRGCDNLSCLGCEFQPFDVSSGSTSGSAQHSHSAPMPAMTRRATSFETPTLATKRTAPYNAKSAQIRSPSLEPFYAGERDDTDWSKGAERAAAAPDALSEAPTPRRDAKD